MQSHLLKVENEFKESPFWKFVGLELTEFEQGNVKLKLPYKEEFDNVRSTIHGGIYMSILDTAMGMYCRSLGCTDVQTIQMNTQFLKASAQEEIWAAAGLISESRSTMLVEGKLLNKEQELIGYATATFKIVK